MSREKQASLRPHPSGRSFEIVYVEEQLDEGAKGPLGAIRRRIEKVGVLDFASFGVNLRDFCARIGSTLESVGDSASPYRLDSFELTVEVTAKGEVRFVGSAATEIRGGLKLVFKRSK